MSKLLIILILRFFGIKTSRKELAEIERRQKKKGLEKYGHTLEDCPYDKYDWREMELEEIVDFLQYVKKLKN
jgi:hypothetical protein